MTPRARRGARHELLARHSARPRRRRTSSATVFHVAADDPKTPPSTAHPVTLADLALQPIDFVCAGHHQRGAEAQGATELETRIASHYRRAHGIADGQSSASTSIRPVPDGELTFGQLCSARRADLRALLGEMPRARRAAIFCRPQAARRRRFAVDKTNPAGYDVAELRGPRRERALTALTALADALDGAGRSRRRILTFLHDPTHGRRR